MDDSRMQKLEMESDTHPGVLVESGIVDMGAGRLGRCKQNNSNSETQASSTGVVFACVSHCSGSVPRRLSG